MRQYKSDRTTQFLFNAFTGLAIIISCLGLYGLVSLITIQRTKEIGIRKVLGAPIHRLVLLLSADQLWLIGWASLIALPLAALGRKSGWPPMPTTRVSTSGYSCCRYSFCCC